MGIDWERHAATAAEALQRPAKRPDEEYTSVGWLDAGTARQPRGSITPAFPDSYAAAVQDMPCTSDWRKRTAGSCRVSSTPGDAVGRRGLACAHRR
ncbi:hypothetical protein CAE01nite_12760 [Cellulomonas aerilata]|uniref:Uncharacterized protein n=1 Tax=Cellulomonas aerilata TaxID=515326 RepID=A0A512DAN8_9CELL|nr:hypothetical protein CAE01nite_12760 [Cellulomonas aerilata]